MCINELAGKTILITGGAGYLATNLMCLLENSDCRIIRLDRVGACFAPTTGIARVENISTDIRRPSIWKDILVEVDIIFHFAAQTSVYIANLNPREDLHINVLPMLDLLETCRREGRHPIILFSGTATEVGITLNVPVGETEPDNPITIYDIHKWMAENYLKQYVRDGIVRGSTLRLANVYGPGPRSSSGDRGVLNMMVQRALNGEELTIYGKGNYLRDYVYVGDVASAFVRALINIDKLDARHYLIGSGEGHSIADAMQMVAIRVEHKTNKCVQVLYVHPPAELSPIEMRNYVTDTRRFAAATNWRATVMLEEGIDKLIDYYMAAKSDSQY
jgi:UDP-glucose 4-epimerase